MGGVQDETEQSASWLGIQPRAKAVVRAGVVLGLGIGGFFDGIVFHQVLQWHHMLSAQTDPTTVTGLRLNVLADGAFHAFTYLSTLAGIGLLWRASQRQEGPIAGTPLLGSVLLGWGLFNLVEGVVDHQLLGIHHVWPAGPGPTLVWDLAFLVWGGLFVVVGYGLVRSGGTARDAK